MYFFAGNRLIENIQEIFLFSFLQECMFLINRQEVSYIHWLLPRHLTSTQRIGRTFLSRGDVMCRRLMTGKISDPNPWPNVFQNFFKIVILPRRGSATHIRHISVLCKSHSTWFFGIVLWLMCQLKATFQHSYLKHSLLISGNNLIMSLLNMLVINRPRCLKNEVLL